MQEEIMDKADAAQQAAEGLSRRRFLTYAGALAGAGMLMASCNDDDDNRKVVPVADNTIDLGSGDLGGANLLYVIDQMSAAFFTKVMETPFVGMDSDTDLFRDMMAHSIAHRELMKELLGAEAKGQVETNFQRINFANRSEVLQHANTITDISVLAYNRVIGVTISNNWKDITSKIASVKSRHNAYAHEMVTAGSFADSADENGMDTKLPTKTILDYASAYIVTKISSANLGY